MSIILISIISLVILSILIPFFLRRVVSTNEVHIIQSRKKTISYGKDMASGNTYYEWPTCWPIIGITKTILPVSVFDLDLTSYEAYDKGRLPFVVDIKAFFRITDSDVAAQRVASFEELEKQLQAVVQGAVRTILASNEIEEIMQGRSKFGEEFTKEVEAQLINWGVSTVKNIEMMDIRDHQGSFVIKNIMEKKKSHIEMESRIEVAKNMQIAKTAEIESDKIMRVNAQVALQAVGQSTAETEKQIGIANEVAIQEIKEQQKVTKEKEMNVLRIEEVRKAEIEKDKQVVQAEQKKETDIILSEGQKQKDTIVAEGVKQQTILKAEGNLQLQKLDAEGIQAQGSAKAEAEKAMQLAPIEAQIKLANEIGNNKKYQTYLISVRKIEADQAIGIEQAKALEKADLKVIANSGDVSTGVNNLMDLFSSKGGTQIGGMLEAISQSEVGKGLISKFTKEKPDKK